MKTNELCKTLEACCFSEENHKKGKGMNDTCIYMDVYNQSLTIRGKIDGKEELYEEFPEKKIYEAILKFHELQKSVLRKIVTLTSFDKIEKIRSSK